MNPIGCRDDGALAKSSADAQNFLARNNRSRFDQQGLLAVNLMCSAGIGTTALLDATIAALGHRHRIAVITNNQPTAPDGPRIFLRGLAAVQVGMATAGYLHAGAVDRALQGLPLDGIKLLLMENVGKLRDCASHDLGQHCRIALLTSADGGESRLELQSILHNTDFVMLSKAGTLEAMPETDPVQVGVALRMLGRRTPLIQTMAQQARSLAPWFQWLEKQLHDMRVSSRNGTPLISGAA